MFGITSCCYIGVPQVDLLTLEGLVQDSTKCAPNGYYFLPLYHKGQFLLRVKGVPGWSFDPQEVSSSLWGGILPAGAF